MFRTIFGCGCCKSTDTKNFNQDQHKENIASVTTVAEELAGSLVDSSETVANSVSPVPSTITGSDGFGDIASLAQTTDHYNEYLVNSFPESPKDTDDEEESSGSFIRNQDELAWARHISVPPQPDVYPYYVTSPVEAMHRKLFSTLFQQFMEDVLFMSSKEGRKQSPFQFLDPGELRNSMDLRLPHKADCNENILDFTQAVCRYLPHMGHPMFLKQNMAGLEPYACMADMIVSSINSNNSCYIMSTVITLIELEVIRAMCQLVNYDSQKEGGDGVFMPGSNLVKGCALRMANLSNKSKAKRPYLFVNERAADSYGKLATFQGFGMDSVISIAALDNGKMDLKELRSQIELCSRNGGYPCMVVGTAGTPMVRAFDELERIADICEEQQIWFHVDATYGGAFLFSEDLREKLKGVERSDSYSCSQQFMLGVPCSSSCVIVPSRHRTKLAQYTGIGEGVGNAFKRTPMYDPQYDMSSKTLLSSKRADVLKMWMTWKAKGTLGLGLHVEQTCKNVQFCLEEMRKREGFQPLLEQFEGANVCFWFVPPCYRGILGVSREYLEKMSRLTVGIKRVLLENGICVLSYNELPPSAGIIKPAFLIIGLHNSAVTRLDICYILDKIESVGEILSNPKHPKYAQFVN